ncbi:MAG: DsrE family protein [Granulosicoccaceae bacterium]
MKRILIATTLSLLALITFATTTSAADEADHRVAIHVDENDKKLMNLALNNITNINKYYESVGETVEIELVAYGPGLHMFRADTSPVIDRITTMSLLHENLTFSACANTHSVMSKKANKEIELLEEATMVPSGVVQLIALQEQGFAYIRP